MPEVDEVGDGAQWRRIDLHLHTPGVHSFRCPPGSDPTTEAGLIAIAERYVQSLVDTGIEIACLTDYQGVRLRWFEAIRALSAQQGISVLPGAELSIGHGGGRGTHLLVICGPNTDPTAINQAVRHMDNSGRELFQERQEHIDVDLRESLAEALRHLREQLDCVVVAAHAKDNNGVLRTIGAEQTADLVAAGLIDAIDSCDNAAERLQGTQRLTPDRLSALACTRSSDPKSVDEIGTKRLPSGELRATWLKLSRVDADAIRLALHDPETRLLTRPPLAPNHPRLVSLEIEGSGFLGHQRIDLNPDLNCIIGGRGAGKSALLESVRYALGGEPFSDKVERLALVDYALGAGGVVRVEVERPGDERPQRYTVSRVLGQRPRVTSSRDDTIEVDPMDLFGPRGRPMILLQREIQSVSRDDGFQRRLLDEIIGDDARRAASIVRRSTEDLRRNARQILEVEERIARRSELDERLATVSAEITYYEGQGLADKFARQGELRRVNAQISAAAQGLDNASGLAELASDEVDEALVGATTELTRRGADGEEEIIRLVDRVEEARGNVARLFEGIEAHLNEVRASVRTVQDQWEARVSVTAAEIRELTSESPIDAINPERYLRAVEEKESLSSKLDEVIRQEQRRTALLLERAALLRGFQDARLAANQLRRRTADDVNLRLVHRLHMDVSYLGDAHEFEADLLALLRGSRMSSEAIHKIASTPAVDGVELMRSVREGPTAVIEQFGITAANADRLVEWLTSQSERGLQAELFAPEDRVVIALVDGTRQRPLEQLSSGQRATALLLLLFAQPGRLLILDQPEDDLDNRFVYEDVVQLLRLEKGVVDPDRRRQVVTATHNANIPVNGDAELVLSLSGEGGRSSVRAASSIDDRTVRDEIRTVLEGGADAFRRRAEKYGGIDDS